MSELPSTQITLLDRIKASSDEAWDSFCEIYGPSVYQWARNQGLQPSDASDVTQETFRTVAEKIVSWKPDSFRSWLWSVFRSRLMDHYRSLKAEPVGHGGSGLRNVLEVSTEPSPLDSVEGRSELRQIQNRALEVVKNKIDENHWAAFLRVAINGDSPADVAEDLGISVWTVYKCRTRVLNRLRREFDGLNLQLEFADHDTNA